MGERSSHIGLRERKKEETRRALSSAALRLAIERGLDNVLIEDIASAANVSPRTFNNYFANKYEAVVGLAVDKAQQVGTLLLARPEGEPLWDSIVHAVLAQYLEAERSHDVAEQEVRYQAWVAGLDVMTSLPALRGEVLKFYEATQLSLADGIAKRLGVDVERDMLPSLLAGAVSAASEVAVRHWMRDDPKARGSLAQRVRKALKQLARAFTDGVTAASAKRGHESRLAPKPRRAEPKLRRSR